jgi:S1-C subfamily serine protease
MLGLKSSRGVVVTQVSAGSAAATAGLRPGDVLDAIDGKPLRSAQDLRNAEGLLPLGSTLKLSVLRDGQLRQVDATLTPEKLATLDGARLDPRLAGVGFSDLSQRERSQGVAGVVVSAVRPGSLAAQAGLQPDDLVIGVGNRRITSVRELQALAGTRPRQLVLLVGDQDGVHYVVLN